MPEATKAKILIAASEFEPYTNIGHLGRVVQNLSAALAKAKDGEPGGSEHSKSVDVRVVIPNYSSIPDKYLRSARRVCGFETSLGRRTSPCTVYQTIFYGVTVYLVSCGDYFNRDHVYSSVVDDIERFSCFCNAVIAMLPRIDFMPDVIQCHDWHMSYIPTLYRTSRGRRASDMNIKTLFVIHSMQYQGMCSRYEMLDLLDLSSEFFTPAALEFYGQANSLKGGLLFSDKLVTVSANYAREIRHAYYGENLEGIIRARDSDLYGIICGIDPQIYNPAADERIFCKYDASTVYENKPKNKERLQGLLGFEQSADVPVVIIIADELDYDKGVELIKFVFDDIVALGVQIIFASKGKSDYHDFFSYKASEYKGKVAYVRYNASGAWGGAMWAGWDRIDEQIKKDEQSLNGLAKASDALSETMLICGSDMLLRPSRIEPCGEKHLIALKYGTLPIVRETGGLEDAVVAYTESGTECNGFSFFNYNAHDMLYTINRALETYRNNGEAWRRLIGAAMRVNITWEGAAAEYIKIYEELRKSR